MSDFDNLINKIHEKSEAEKNEAVLLTTDGDSPDLPAPEEVNDDGAVTVTAQEEPPVTDRVMEEAEKAARVEEAAAAAPAKVRHSRFRKADAGFVNVSGEETSDAASFADRYSVGSGTADDSAFGRFSARFKTKKFEKPQDSPATQNELDVLNAAIGGAPESEEKNNDAETLLPAEDADTAEEFAPAPEFSGKDVTKNVTGGFEFNEALSLESEDPDGDCVKIADKSEILQRLATADIEEFDDETLRQIEADVADNISKRLENIYSDDTVEEEADGKDKNGKKVFAFLSPENLKNLRLRFAHLNPALNRVDCGEFSGPDEIAAKKEAVAKKRKLLLYRGAALCVFFIITAVMNIVASASVFANGGQMQVFGGSTVAYALCCLVLLVLSAAAAFPELRSGVYAMLRLKPKATTMLACAYFAAFIQCFASMGAKHIPEWNFHILSAAVIAVTVSVLVSEEFYYRNLALSLNRCEMQLPCGVLAEVTGSAAAAEMLRDDASSGKAIHYPAAAGFIKNTVSAGEDASASSEIRGRIDAIFGVLSLVCGIVALIVSRSFAFAVTAVTGSLLFSIPVSAVLAGAVSLFACNKAGFGKGIHIVSAGDAKAFTGSDNLVVNDDEIFTAKINDVLTVNSVSSEQMKLIAAIIAKKAGGVLASAFSDVIAENGDSFPDVADFDCESRLGVSGWISDCRVLMGNRSFMDSHSVAIQYDYIESALDRGTEKIYLSINGSFVACFGLIYSPVQGAVENLRRLVKQGTNLIILATDPNLSDDIIEKMLSFPADSVRVFGTGAVENFCRERSSLIAEAPAGVVFNPDFGSFIDTVGYALDLSSRTKLVNYMAIGMGALGAAVALIFSASKAAEAFSVWAILLLQAMFDLAAIFLPSVFGGETRSEKVRPTRVKKQPRDFSAEQKKAAAGNDAADAVYTGRTPAPAVDEPAPVYVAVNETPDPVEASVNPAKLPEDITDDDFRSLLEYIDAPEQKYVPEKKKNIFGIAGEKLSASFGVIKEKLGNDYVEEPENGEYSENGTFPEYGDYNDYGAAEADYGEAPRQRNTRRYASHEMRGTAAQEAVSAAAEKIRGGISALVSGRPGRKTSGRQAGGRNVQLQNSGKPRDYYNSGNISTGEGYDFVGRYSGDNMFRGLNEDDAINDRPSDN